MLTTVSQVPFENVVPSMAELLDAEAVLSLCRNHWTRMAEEARSEWKAARMIEALYHPRRHLRVAYVMLSDPDTPANRYWPEGQIVYFHSPARTTESRRGNTLTIDGRSVEVYGFPNDRRLRGLRLAAGRNHCEKMWADWEAKRGYRAMLDASSLQRTMVRYVPEQKWVVRLRANWTGNDSSEEQVRRLAVRACRPSVCATLAQRHRELATDRVSHGVSFRIPEVVGESSEMGLLGVEWIRGLSLIEALRQQDAATIMSEVSRRLANLHATNVSGLERVSPRQLAAKVRFAARDLALAAPEKADVINELEEACIASLNKVEDSGETVTLHNDFHWNQVSIKKDRFALFDLDRMVQGDALIDVATLAAQLEMLSRRPDVLVSHEESRRWRVTFLQSWAGVNERSLDVRRLHLYCAVARWELARGLLRHLRPGWNTFADSCLELIESDLRLSNTGDWL